MVKEVVVLSMCLDAPVIVLSALFVVCISPVTLIHVLDSDEGRNNGSGFGTGPLRKMGLTDEECEAAVVAGNVPQLPPVPPKLAAPTGIPVVSSLQEIRSQAAISSLEEKGKASAR